MDIWMTWCTRVSKCKHCSNDIVSGTPMVMGKLWRKHSTGVTPPSVMRFPLVFRWHPQCWVDQGILSLKDYAEVHRDRHRPRLLLTDEQRLVRKRLIGRWRTYRFRMRVAMESNDMDYLRKLVENMRQVALEIEQVGGMPKKWAEML